MEMFKTLGLSDLLLETIGALGYQRPTPIQSKTIPLLLAGSDVIGQAQTGTGKTAAFLLPLLEQLEPTDAPPQALILTPTRELAIQINDAFKRYRPAQRALRSCLLYGGQPIGPQIHQLARSPHLIVGTPGRVIDHIQRGTLELSALRFLVLDEADEMLRMGFIDDVEQIISKTPSSRQSALFSATMPAEVERIARRHLHEGFELVRVQGGQRTSDDVEQFYLPVRQEQKFDALRTLLELESEGIVLVFARTRRDTTFLADQLQMQGYAAEALNGEMSQELREGVVRRLREGRVRLIVATDVAARGLDIDGISQVINYDIPQDLEAYVHRIGRTGRAGKQGRALLLVTPRERYHFFQLERQLQRQLTRFPLPSRERLLAGRKSSLKDQLREQLFVEESSLYQEVLAELVDSGHSLEAIAVAAVRAATRLRPLCEEALPSPIESLDFQQLSERRRVISRQSEGQSVIHLALGRCHGLRPKDIVGAVANESQIDGRRIGAIQIGERESLIELPDELTSCVLKRMEGRLICGQPALLSRWNGEPIEEARKRGGMPRRRPHYQRQREVPTFFTAGGHSGVS